MTTDTHLRDRLQSRANEHDISVSSLHDITTAADRGARRSLVTGSFCAVALVLISLLSFAGLRTSERPTGMFAGLDAENAGSPATIIATDDGWLGAVLVYDEVESPPSTAWTDWRGEVYLATSEDGQSWELAEPTGLTSTSSELAIDEHDGRLWLALTEGDKMYLAFSDDLEKWTRVDIAGVDDFEIDVVDGMERVVSVRKVVANSAGVMATAESRLQPNFQELLDIDHDQTCSIRWTTSNSGAPASIAVRFCGEPAWVNYELEDIDLSMTGPESTLVFSPDGETFERIDSPHSDRIVQPYSNTQSLYSTETGFGIADYGLLESSNGIDWTTINVNRWSSPTLAAARGDVRLTSAVHHVRTVDIQMSVDGQDWVWQSLDEALGNEPTEGNHFFTRAIEVGEAGWVVSGSLSHPETFENEFSETATDSILQLGDYELRGVLPAGPADLVAPDGEILASWDDFELTDPRRNEQVLVENEEFMILDNEGEPLIKIPFESFLTELRMSATQPVNTVLFSADGETWTEIHRGLDFVMGVAVGDDEVVIATASMQGPTSIRIPIEEVEAE